MTPRLSVRIAAVLALTANAAQADAVTEWNSRSCDVIMAAGMVVQPATRIMAIAHTAALQGAERAAAGREGADRQTAMEAAIASAHRMVLLKLVPAQQAAVDAAYLGAVDKLAPDEARKAGIAAGDQAASALLALRDDDGAARLEAYRPATVPGRYVPTTVPAVPHWPQRRPWLILRADQFRPGPPPPLASERWARDFNEIQAIGGRVSPQRTAEQTEIARFWETTAPPIYHAIVRGVAEQPGRDLLRNARLFAALTQGMDDAMIAVFDAKYHHSFWRPVTAIRNADDDGNESTQRDASWLPLLSTPMHPEYPCAHCTQAGVVAGVLLGEGRSNAVLPALRTRSASANGTERSWTNLDDFVREVGNARVYGGMHYRFSTEAGAEMGQRIGALAASRHLGE